MKYLAQYDLRPQRNLVITYRRRQFTPNGRQKSRITPFTMRQFIEIFQYTLFHLSRCLLRESYCQLMSMSFLRLTKIIQ